MHNVNVKTLTNGTKVAWSVNEHGAHVMLDAGFSGIVELHTVGQPDKEGVIDQIQFRWRHHLKHVSLPKSIENQTLETAKAVAQSAYMFHGVANE